MQRSCLPLKPKFHSKTGGDHYDKDDLIKSLSFWAKWCTGKSPTRFLGFCPQIPKGCLKIYIPWGHISEHLQGSLYTFILCNTNLSLIVPKIYILLNNLGTQQSFSQVFISLSWYKLWQYLKFICHYYTLLQNKQEIQVHPPSKQQLGPTKGRDNLLQNQQRGKKAEQRSWMAWTGREPFISALLISIIQQARMQGFNISVPSGSHKFNQQHNSCLNRALTSFFLNTRMCTRGLEVVCW